MIIKSVLAGWVSACAHQRVIVRRWGNVVAISVGPVQGVFGEQSLGSWALQSAAVCHGQGQGEVAGLSGLRVVGSGRLMRQDGNTGSADEPEEPHRNARAPCAQKWRYFKLVRKELWQYNVGVHSTRHGTALTWSLC